MNQRSRQRSRRSRLARFVRIVDFGIGLVISAAAQADATAISVGNASVTADSATTLNFPLTRTGDTGYDAYLNYKTADGTAAAGTDYLAASGTLKVPAGAASASIPVSIKAGSGADKNFQLLLDNAVGVGPTPSFAPQLSLVTADSPDSVTSADLNGDGLPDLIDVSHTQQAITVHLNTTPPGATTPGFQPRQSLPSTNKPTFVTTADLNGDGRPDLLLGTTLTSNVSVRLNTTPPGATTVSLADEQIFATGLAPNSIAVADFNGDGRPDLVATNSFGSVNSVSVLLNTTAPGAASASFAGQQTFATGSTPLSVAAADVNGDGRPDLVVANFDSQTVSVLLNNTGPGASAADFAPQQSFAVASFAGAKPFSIRLADLNGDGRPDLVVGIYSGPGSNSTSVLLNITAPGATTMSFAAPRPVSDTGGGAYATTADLNGDGRPDVLTSNSGSTNSFFGVYPNLTAPGSTTPNFATLPYLTADAGVSSIFAVDLNGDGKPDVVTLGTDTSSLSVLLNTTPTTGAAFGFGTPADFGAGGNPLGIARGDLNGDGRPDLVTANVNSKTVTVLLDTTPAGASTPSFSAAATFAVGTAPYSVKLGDFNGDGRLDIVTANSQGSTVSVLLNTTAPGAAAPSFSANFEFPAGAVSALLAIGDLDLDGRADIAVTDAYSNTIAVLRNTTAPGATTPSFAAPLSFPTGTTPFGLTIADLNGDGLPDLVATNRGSITAPGNTVAVLLNTTVPGVAPISFATHTDFTTGTVPYAVIADDFDGDGKPDLFVTNAFDGTLSVLRNTTVTGSITPDFATNVDLVVGNTPLSLDSGDVDGDGRPDLVIGHNGPGGASVSFLLNRTPFGATSPVFAGAFDYGVDAGGTYVALADFNGDGQLDVAYTYFGGTRISVILNTLYTANLGRTSATGTLHYTGACPTGTLAFRAKTGNSGMPAFTFGENASLATITVSRTGGSCGAASVSYATTAGSAASGVNYDDSFGTLNWAAGDTADKTFTVPLHDDNVYASTLTANLGLSGASGASLGRPASALLQIKNVDARPTVALTPSSQDMAKSSGGVVSITATLTRPSANTITLPFVFSGSAQNKRDYAYLSDGSGRAITTIVIPAGQTRGSVSIRALNSRPTTPATVVATLRMPINGATPGIANSATINLLGR